MMVSTKIMISKDKLPEFISESQALIDTGLFIKMNKSDANYMCCDYYLLGCPAVYCVLGRRWTSLEPGYIEMTFEDVINKSSAWTKEILYYNLDLFLRNNEITY